jgi:hypothetical protein
VTSFIADPKDYIGTHRYSAAPVFEVCDCHEVCGAVFRVDDVAPDNGHEPQHAYTVPGFPYVTYVGGVRVENVDDESLRDVHDTRFPITGGLYEGFSLGGRQT